MKEKWTTLCKTLKLWLTSLFIIAGFASYQNQSIGKTLFAIPFGEKKGQVLFSTWRQNLDMMDSEQDPPYRSPMLRVSKDGQIIALSYPSKDDEASSSVIRLFDTKGKPTRSIGLPLDGIHGYVLGTNMLVVWDSNQLYVLDTEGVNQVALTQGYRQALNRVQSAGIKLRRLLTIDYTHTVYFQATLNNQLKTIALSSSGEYELFDYSGPVQFGSAYRYEILPFGTSNERTTQTHYDVDGSVLSIEDVARFAKRKVQVYGGDNSLITTYQIPNSDLTEAERSLTYSLSPCRVSDSGHLLVVLEPLICRLVSEGDYQFFSFYQLRGYSSQGKRLKVEVSLRVPSCHSYHDDLDYLWDIDREGNLYYLDFQADHLKVMKVPAR